MLVYIRNNFILYKQLKENLLTFATPSPWNTLNKE